MIHAIAEVVKKYKYCHWRKDQLKATNVYTGKGLKEDISPRHRDAIIGGLIKLKNKVPDT